MADDRAVSVPVNYVLLVAIVTVLASLLLLAGGDVVADQRERTARAGLDVAGNMLANELSTADRLASVAGTDAVSLHESLPRRVGGATYLIRIDSQPGGDGWHDVTLTLTTDATAVTRRVRLRTAHPVENVTVAGGPVVVRYDAGTDRLEVTDG